MSKTWRAGRADTVAPERRPCHLAGFDSLELARNPEPARYLEPVVKPLDLPFDPIERAASIWQRRFGDARAMAAVTSIMRAQQILIAELDALLRPFGLTFARYEALVLLIFCRT